MSKCTVYSEFKHFFEPNKDWQNRKEPNQCFFFYCKWTLFHDFKFVLFVVRDRKKCVSERFFPIFLCANLVWKDIIV